MPSTQPSKLLASLFQHVGDDERLSVLDIGPAMPETVNFLSHYRCKLFCADLFSELPIVAGEEGEPSISERLDSALAYPAHSRFDICLFWNIFNYLSTDAIAALLHKLRPNLHRRSMAHGFAMHNVNTAQGDHVYGVIDKESLAVRHRGKPLPGYAPHGQTQLKHQLGCFNFERTVLLSDSRLEFVLSSKL